jgi:hypothetical protein
VDKSDDDGILINNDAILIDNDVNYNYKNIED